ncbi:MAG TPA: TIGR02996 domain-containing protein [Gemmataceae bacterium]|nr:TIGR02996 domain-containing protein [Gemmataceae bacterium]
MSDAALIAAIRAAQDDDAPRLVYADWLEEHGQPERAEFIRLQCELARGDSPDLRAREAELLAIHLDAFAGSLASPGLRFRFRRGFIVAFGHNGAFQHPFQDLVDGCLVSGVALLRFYPNGTVCSVSLGTDSGRGIAEARELLSPDRPLNTRGTYTLSSFAFPARLVFTLTGVEGDVDYCGKMEGPSLVLDVHSHINGNRSRRRYTHVSISGFDSFSETS